MSKEINKVPFGRKVDENEKHEGEKSIRIQEQNKFDL